MQTLPWAGPAANQPVWLLTKHPFGWQDLGEKQHVCSDDKGHLEQCVGIYPVLPRWHRINLLLKR